MEFSQFCNFNFERRTKGGFGSDIGPLKGEDGRVVEVGKFMMRRQWNTDFYRPLVENNREICWSIKAGFLASGESQR